MRPWFRPPRRDPTFPLEFETSLASCLGLTESERNTIDEHRRSHGNSPLETVALQLNFVTKRDALRCRRRREIEARIASCLKLSSEDTQAVVRAQCSGNTANFEDIAVQLGMVPRSAARHCQYAQLLPGLARAFPNLVNTAAQAAIAVFTIANFALYLVVESQLPPEMAQTKPTYLTVEPIPHENMEMSASNVYKLDGRSVPMEDKHGIHDKDRPSKLVMVVTNTGDADTGPGCLKGSMKRGDVSHAQDVTENLNLPPAGSAAFLMHANAKYSLSWIDLSFDRGCDNRTPRKEGDVNVTPIPFEPEAGDNTKPTTRSGASE